MKIVIFSSVFNHHSMPLCDALNELPDVDCIFVETMEEETERKQLGYHPYGRAYVLNMLLSDENREKALDLALTADVMIASVFPYEFLKQRLDRNKLTFLCQERMFKGGATVGRRLRAWLFNMRKFHRFRCKPLYFLAIGKNSAMDYKSIGFYKNKCFQWAYFPPVITYDSCWLMEQKRHKTVQLLFVGRLIPLKHPEYPLRALKELVAKGVDIHLNYIGMGEMENTLKEEAEEVSQFVSFLGSMPPEQVRFHMEQANIVAFTSNSTEGWGAVINEAMNSGCAIVAAKAAGSVVTMLQDGVNGCVYDDEDYDDFFQKLEMLVQNQDTREQLGMAAYETITKRYNARIAGERLYNTCTALLNGKIDYSYPDDLMSKLY